MKYTLQTIALLILTAPALARAGTLSSVPPLAQPIYNGTEVAGCGWPSVVSMQGQCSGTLVHPEVVVFAGHCGPDYDSVQFGENGEQPARSVKTAGCWADDGGVGMGHDFAVCRLAEPVTDIPIVPILMGCEVEALQPGVTVTLIGFGAANTGPYGIKRETTAQIAGFVDDEIFIANDQGQDTCYGDSGGPVMIALADGTWRVFGVTSYGIDIECGTGTYYSMLHNGIPWLEAKTGVDITPCHTADGLWDPGPACGGFPEAPALSAGTWVDSCQPDGPIGGPSETCGAPFDTLSDSEPPQAAIVSPAEDTEYTTSEPLQLRITASARDDVDKPEGWGIAELRLHINGEELPHSARAVVPYTWDVTLPSGGYLISAVATDHAGNEALAVPVAVGVNEAPPALPVESSSESGGETGDDSDAVDSDTPTSDESDPPATGSSDTGVDTTDLQSAEDGCGCRQRRPGAPDLGLLVLTLVAAPRLRRARA
jgi:hypothetical protein